jgi:signal transduction histidine kinase
MNPAQIAQTSQTRIRVGRIAYGALYLVFLAVVTRTLAVEKIRPILQVYLGGELLFLVLYSAVNIARDLPSWILHLYFALQSALIWWLLSLYPEFDFLILLYLLLSAQASELFRRQRLWFWVGVFVILSGGSLIYFLGVARGLALSLTTIAAEIVVPAYIIVYNQNEIARYRSQALLGELQEANQRLQSYADQVEELTTMHERNRLARELHDTVSQVIFSISLTTRSAQVLLGVDPARLSEQLEHLQVLTGEALAQMRSLITKLRPPQHPEQVNSVPTSKDLIP